MARKQIQDEPAVRKGLLIAGGAALGAAVLGFLIIHFALGGGESTPPATQSQTQPGVVAPAATPTPSPDVETTSGGRDPFAGPQGLAAVPPAPASAAAASAAAPAPTASVLASAQVNKPVEL